MRVRSGKSTSARPVRWGRRDYLDWSPSGRDYTSRSRGGPAVALGRGAISWCSSTAHKSAPGGCSGLIGTHRSEKYERDRDCRGFVLHKNSDENFTMRHSCVQKCAFLSNVAASCSIGTSAETMDCNRPNSGKPGCSPR